MAGLPRPPRGAALVSPSSGVLTQQGEVWIESWLLAIEAQFGAVNAAIAAQAAADAANAAAAAAQSAADDATTAADNAQTAADTSTAQTDLIGSYPSGATITATDAGANATITISGHDRIYAISAPLTVAGGSVTGLSYSTLYFIYYIDATRADATPSYLATISEASAAQTGDTHLVGSVTTPSAAGGPVGGDYVQPPGVGDIR